jgi:hypothetical protein
MTSLLSISLSLVSGQRASSHREVSRSLASRFIAGVFALIFATGLATCSLAQETLSSTTVSAWTAKGTAPTIDPTQGTVTLSAGSELTRIFDASQVSLRVVSQPYFSPAASGWPALELGPASVAFVQGANGGGMVLLGDQMLTLPFTIALGTDGRSLQPLDFTLSYNQPGSVATLSMAGQTFSQPATASTGSVQATISAGATTAWPLNTVEVTAVSGANLANTVPSTTSPTGTTPTPTGGLVQPAQSLAATLEQRSQLAVLLLKGQVTPAQAVGQLRLATPSPLQIDPDTDFSLAAISIGEQLTAYGKYEAAQPFFAAAEPVLVNVSKRVLSTNEQALCLKTLAWIRSRYLNELAQAKLDIEAAYQLNPADKNLQALRQRLTGKKPTT